GHGPAAAREPAVAVLVLASRGLDDAVERDELVNDELSHGLRSQRKIVKGTPRRPRARWMTTIESLNSMRSSSGVSAGTVSDGRRFAPPSRNCSSPVASV